MKLKKCRRCHQGLDIDTEHESEAICTACRSEVTQTMTTPDTPPPKSETPRVDAALRDLILVGIKYGFSESLLHEFANDARQLERENTRLKERVAELEKPVCELALCEHRSLCLKPNQNYRFLVYSNCAECEAMAKEALALP